MDRRSMLKASGTLLAGVGLGGCAPTFARESAPRIRVGWDRVLRHSVGLRPYRPKGLRLEAERIGTKTIIHNYGHGGSGVSLSWGTAHLAADMAQQLEVIGEAAVIGAGAVGLATARTLQRRGWKVTIYTRELWPDPTVCSGHAPARFTPGFSLIDDEMRTPEFDAMYERAAALSYQYWHDMVGPRYGVSWMYQYRPTDQMPAEGPGESSATGVGERVVLREGEHPFPTEFAIRSLTISMDMPVFLEQTLQDFQRWGGQVVIRPFYGRDSVLSLSERVVCNCSGLGASEVWEDDGMEPLKGQLTLLVPQPEVDFVVTGGGMSLVPRSNSLLLGGAPNVEDSWSMEADEVAAREVVERARELFEGMRPAPRVASLSRPVPPAPGAVQFFAKDLVPASALTEAEQGMAV